MANKKIKSQLSAYEKQRLENIHKRKGNKIVCKLEEIKNYTKNYPKIQVA